MNQSVSISFFYFSTKEKKSQILFLNKYVISIFLNSNPNENVHQSMCV